MALSAATKDFARRLFDTVREMSADVRGVTRQGYGPVETKVLEFLKDEGRKLGLEIETDAAGNVWMTMKGRDSTRPAFVAGSHVDSVPQGGNFDGLAGVVAALVAAKHMHDEGVVPAVDYRVLMMRCEESSFFGKAYVGSLGMLGRLKASDLALRHRTEAGTLADAIRSTGVDPERLTTGEPVVEVKKIGAFVELHIEQGPTLTSRESPRVGVVTGIRGNIRHKNVVCLGETAHSGAVNKEYRHDAVMAAAHLFAEMDAAWDEFLAAGKDLVFTVGVLKTGETAAISVIPGEVRFTIDMRSLKKETLDEFHARLEAEAKKLEAARGVRFVFDDALYTAPSVLLPAAIVKMFSSSAATGLVLDIFKEYGPDSSNGLIVSLMGSCTETIFYTMSVYFMSVGIRKTRWTLAGALVATLAGLIASVILGRML